VARGSRTTRRIRSCDRLLETVRAAREQQQEFSRRLLTAQEEERRHLAVELHDELGQATMCIRRVLPEVALDYP